MKPTGTVKYLNYITTLNEHTLIVFAGTVKIYWINDSNLDF